jgi:hypothetical protein
MKQITLAKEVMVSDPCYSEPTMGQTKLDNVKPGNYYTFHKEHDSGDLGIRSSMIMVIHQDHINDRLTWKKHAGEVGVDSGQAGIYSYDTYRKDGLDIEVPDKTYDGREFFLPVEDDGDDWYLKMCKITLSEKGWGTYSNGIISRSGFGDGGYPLFTVSKGKQIIALAIDFGVEETKYIDFDWYKSELVLS